MKRVVFLAFVLISSCNHQKNDNKRNDYGRIQSDVEIEHEAHVRTETFKFLLDLTPDQTEMIYHQIVKDKTIARTIKLESTSREDYMARKKINVHDRYKEFQAVLTPEQNKKLEPYIASNKYFVFLW